jgi:hypothetical protein
VKFTYVGYAGEIAKGLFQTPGYITFLCFPPGSEQILGEDMYEATGSSVNLRGHIKSMHGPTGGLCRIWGH